MAREFVATSSEALTITPPGPITATPFTLACWGWFDTSLVDSVLMSIGDSDGTQYHALMYYDSWIRAYTYGSASGGAAVSTNPSPDTWFHGCGVWAADDDRRVYMNGANKGTSAVSATVAGYDGTKIAVTADSTPYGYFAGKIAEAAVWNVALTDAEVAILAKGYSPLFVRPQNLVAYWPLIRDEDQDRVGGYDLTPTNAPTIATHVPKVIYPALAHYPMPASTAAISGLFRRGAWRGVVRGTERGV